MLRTAAKYSIAIAYLMASSSLAMSAPRQIDCRIVKPGTIEYRLCRPTAAIPAN